MRALQFGALGKKTRSRRVVVGARHLWQRLTRTLLACAHTKPVTIACRTYTCRPLARANSTKDCVEAGRALSLLINHELDCASPAPIRQSTLSTGGKQYVNCNEVVPLREWPMRMVRARASSAKIRKSSRDVKQCLNVYACAGSKMVACKRGNCRSLSVAFHWRREGEDILVTVGRSEDTSLSHSVRIGNGDGVAGRALVVVIERHHCCCCSGRHGARMMVAVLA